MLSIILDPFDGYRIGDDASSGSTALKELFNSTPRPYFQTMWDPDVVLAYFSPLPDNGDLTLIAYSQKLATLIALSCQLRV